MGGIRQVADAPGSRKDQPEGRVHRQPGHLLTGDRKRNHTGQRPEEEQRQHRHRAQGKHLDVLKFSFLVRGIDVRRHAVRRRIRLRQQFAGDAVKRVPLGLRCRFDRQAGLSFGFGSSQHPLEGQAGGRDPQAAGSADDQRDEGPNQGQVFVHGDLDRPEIVPGLVAAVDCLLAGPVTQRTDQADEEPTPTGKEGGVKDHVNGIEDGRAAQENAQVPPPAQGNGNQHQRHQENGRVEDACAAVIQRVEPGGLTQKRAGERQHQEQLHDHQVKGALAAQQLEAGPLDEEEQGCQAEDGETQQRHQQDGAGRGGKGAQEGC